VAEPTVADEQPDYRRALSALQWALEQAEHRSGEPTPPEASSAEYRQAAQHHRAELRELVDQVVMTEDADRGLSALLECGALEALLPAVVRMVGFSDSEWRHKDVWKHTKQVVRQAVPRLAVRWAAVLHDIGKVKTRSIGGGGQVHFFGHAEVGARMFDKMERRTALFADDPELKASVRFLVLHHLRASQYRTSWTDSAVRRFAREMGCHMDDLLCLSRADITTKRPERKRRGLRQINELQSRVSELAALDAHKPPLPKGVGGSIMEAFGLPPSKRIGDIKRNLEQAVAAGQIDAHQEAEIYVDFLRQNPALLEAE
jgi:poly(A) polymerase